MSLNDTKIRNLKPPVTPIKLSDSHGLYLHVKPTGSRLWYLKYRINRKESRLGLGTCPDVSLADARQQIREISGHQELIFPGDHNPYKPMCENTVNKALRLMGYDTKNNICGHGFRAMACSALMESGLWAQDAVERQMSHQERNSVRAAYIHKAEYLDARKAMMQWWSDHLDMCRKAYVPPYICRKGSICTMGLPF
ncbi:integrase family protein [Pectobacteriaceae bacterium CE90]|nr:integrase family protein [Pectobacteriaceae bacterium CE90]